MGLVFEVNWMGWNQLRNFCTEVTHDSPPTISWETPPSSWHLRRWRVRKIRLIGLTEVGVPKIKIQGTHRLNGHICMCSFIGDVNITSSHSTNAVVWWNLETLRMVYYRGPVSATPLQLLTVKKRFNQCYRGCVSSHIPWFYHGSTMVLPIKTTPPEP